VQWLKKRARAQISPVKKRTDFSVVRNRCGGVRDSVKRTGIGGLCRGQGKKLREGRSARTISVINKRINGHGSVHYIQGVRGGGRYDDMVTPENWGSVIQWANASPNEEVLKKGV